MEETSARVATNADLEKIARFNRTEKAFPHQATLPQLIDLQFEKSSSATAVFCDDDNLFGGSSPSYGQLNEKVNQVAHRLRANGAKPDQIVGLMVERSYAMIVGIFGIIKSGAAYLPISPCLPAERIDYMLKDAGVKLLLVQTGTAQKIEFAGTILNLDEPQTYEGQVRNPPIVNKPRDLAYVIYTSGSTGKPKGVMIEHRSVINRLSWMQNAYPIGEGDVILQKTPFHFDVSVWELFWWALNRAKLFFLAPGAEALPLRIVDAVKKHNVSVIHFVPPMLNVFLEYLDGKDVKRLASLRRVFSSGEALTPAHVRRFNTVLGSKTGARLTNLYGPTETTVDVSYFDCPDHNDVEKIPIGRPIDNTRFYIIKNALPVAIGEIGELCVGGVGLARGYLNNSSLTSVSFVDNFGGTGERIYRTGDNARWLPDGNIEYLGREDAQVKIRGVRIELGEIESAIRDYEGAADCLCMVKQYSENIIFIIAYVVGRRDFEIEGLKEHLKKYLPDYMLPNHFEKIDRIPLGASGKADRKALPLPIIQVNRP